MAQEWSKQIFAKNLRYYMGVSGKNQKELAEVAGVSAPTFNEWINAKKFPRIDKIQKLADYFGILKSDLIEEKLTEEKEKDNDLMADVVVRMRMDTKFRNLVFSLYHYDDEKIESIAQVLNAFDK
jgi:transcriptional regulator with XRE-family HTH domain